MCLGFAEVCADAGIQAGIYIGNDGVESVPVDAVSE
jgi:hypothetical protein